ncbi:hypothetical protein LSH36_1125g00005 [Paralvinella palmiformis]|uniref:Uncharacterized protein n=1 Tax=Paralvinella palmiformis TaxID=53620 RepID=A0AAD9IUM9_9ANNE|nr:hypothetical protein LSH36_1125g00005 [Paralvinella palmiformis]
MSSMIGRVLCKQTVYREFTDSNKKVATDFGPSKDIWSLVFAPGSQFNAEKWDSCANMEKIGSILEIVVLLLSVQLSSACCSYYGCYCVYTLWYFWFGLFWIVVFFVILVVGCIKKKKQAQNRINNMTVISGNAQQAVYKGPVPPPSYGQPGHQPPPYQAVQQNQPKYPPIQANNPQAQASNPPPEGNLYPPPPPVNPYPPTYPPPPANDPAYPPNP